MFNIIEFQASFSTYHFTWEKCAQCANIVCNGRPLPLWPARSHFLSVNYFTWRVWRFLIGRFSSFKAVVGTVLHSTSLLFRTTFWTPTTSQLLTSHLVKSHSPTTPLLMSQCLTCINFGVTFVYSNCRLIFTFSIVSLWIFFPGSYVSYWIWK